MGRSRDHVVAVDMPNQTKYERHIVTSKQRYTKDKKLNANLKKLNVQYKDAVKSAASTDILLQEESGFLEVDEGSMEKTYKFKQDEIVKEVDLSTSNKKFSLNLKEFGPYSIDYTRNGKDLLIGGKKGHIASIDWRLGKLDCELHLNETVHSIKYLHNDQYFAVAQKKYVFIYDKTGMELHRLKQHIDTTLLDFLPYHLLLTTAGNTGFLKYHDVSTGELVSEHRTKLGPTQCMKQNPWNAVMHLGHSNGQITLWSPSMSTPLAKIQACRGPVRSLSINRNGNYMVVAGSDKTLKIWDIRNFKELDTYYTPTQANSVDISDTDLISVGWGPHITIWNNCFKKKQNSPYMNHMIPSSQIQNTKFVPFEDLLGIGHNNGFESIIVPGSGEANFDALELNPFETSKQRQESEIRSLMNKLKPDMITLDPNVIGSVDKRAPSERLTTKEKSQQQQEKEQNQTPLKTENDVNNLINPNVKGKNSSLRKAKRKQTQNVINERSKRVEAALKKEKDLRRKKISVSKGGHVEKDDILGNALSRFN